LALLEISIVPVGTDATSFSSTVAEACREAKRNGIKFDVTPIGTVMEGDLPALLNVAEQMHNAAFHHGSQRVVTNIAIDDRRDREMQMEHSVRAVRSGM
jgi:uncharacterized protein (TIGR00106 family)